MLHKIVFEQVEMKDDDPFLISLDNKARMPSVEVYNREGNLIAIFVGPNAVKHVEVLDWFGYTYIVGSDAPKHL